MKTSLPNLLKTTFLFTLLMLFVGSVHSQHDRDFEKKREEIKAQKIAYITTQLNLTLWDEMIERGWGDLDHSALHKLYE